MLNFLLLMFSIFEPEKVLFFVAGESDMYPMELVEWLDLTVN